MFFNGGAFTDECGKIRFVNEFDFKQENIRRLYLVPNTDVSIRRAWQGHQKEIKYFFVIKGSFKIGWVTIDDWQNPSRKLSVKSEILNSTEPKILKIAEGTANGLRALENDSVVCVFSNFTLEESKEDNFKFNQEFWAF